MTHSFVDEAVALEEQRRSAGERLTQAEAVARALIVGQEFRYRDEMKAFLVAACEAEVGRPLAPSGVGMMGAVAIGLWPDYARAHGIDIKMITEEAYTLVAKARTQKNAPPMRTLRRELDTLLPGQCNHPSSDRKLERGAY